MIFDEIFEIKKKFELLLQMHNTRCILNTYSSNVEISQNSIKDYQTSNFKIDKYLTKKCRTLIVGIVPWYPRPPTFNSKVA